MNKNQMREKFVDRLLGRLPEADAAEFDETLNNDPEIKREFGQYRLLMEMTQELGRRDAKAHPSFSAAVMEKVERERRPGRIPGLFGPGARRALTWAATGATAMVLATMTVTFLGKEASESFSRIGSSINTTGSEWTDLMSAKQSTGNGIRNQAQKSAGIVRSEIGGVDEYNSKVKALAKEQDSAVYPGRKLEAPVPPAAVEEKRRMITQGLQAGMADMPQSEPFAAPKDKKGVRPDGMRDAEGVSRQSYEQYGQYEENDTLSPKEQPLSTFGLDVDTGSYTNTRRMLLSGSIPPRDSIRIEEFLNYFSYDYPAAADNKPFSLHYEIAPSPLKSGRYLMKVGVQAKQAKLNEDEGWNLVFLIDVSGSMADHDKLPLLQRSLKVLVERMRPVDRIAIVTYAGEAGLKLESTDGRHKERINAAIDSLSSGGSTNGSGGIDLAYQVAQQNRRNDGVNRVILATDGDFNVGTYSFDGLMELAEEKRRTGITLTTLGVGQGNYNERNLEQLANRGNGNYFYLDSFEEASRVLGDKLTGNMQVVAKDAKVQVEFNPSRVAAYRLIGYDNRRLRAQDFTDDKIDAGEIGSGHSVTVLYELTLTGSAPETDRELRYQEQSKVMMPPSDNTGELAFIKIRYKEPNGSVSQELQYPVHAANMTADSYRATPDFRFAAAVSYFGEFLRGSKYAGSMRLEDIKELALGSLGPDSDNKRREFVTLVDSASRMQR